MGEINRLINNFIFNIPSIMKSLFWKRDENIVLMDSWFGYKFADNPRFLYQYLSENKDELGLTHVVWVTRNPELNKALNRMGYESYMIDSKESVHYHKVAKYHIVNNSPNNNDGFTGELLEGYSFGAKRINLWHGIAGKGVKFANKAKVEQFSKSKFYNIYLKLNDIRIWRILFEQKGGWGDAYYLAQSKEGVRVLKSFFRLPDNKYILTGYPRVCECSAYLDEEREIVKKLSHYDSTILYLPTFRSNTIFDFKSVAKDLEDILKKKNMLWIQKAHSADAQNNLNNSESENIINLNPNFDINILLPLVDVLVTDYSSCMIEAIGLKKRVVFYVPDYDEYINEDRGLSFNPEVVMCGPKTYNIRELRDVILNINDISIESQEYNTAFELYWSETSNKKLNDIWKDILKQVNSSGNNI